MAALKLVVHRVRSADALVIGGWVVDACLGEQTRPHADLGRRFDLPIPADYWEFIADRWQPGP